MNEKSPNFFTQNLQLWQSLAIVIGSLWLLLGYMDKRFDGLEHRFEKRFDRLEQRIDSITAEIHRIDKEQVRLNSSCSTKNQGG
ncbi:MAG: hypothetical protein SFU25_09495 [Candidatus Caenarcaniphilales bacterium]|nr:hypothetical protein [Candidatus Caenarcaniphilales bacterium]